MGKERLDQTLNDKLTANQNIFVPYVMAGDGGLGKLAERINFLHECGAAAIEIGIPFSDPVADGPTIQLAGQRSINNGTTLKKVLEALEETKEERSIPIIIMCYLNPIFVYGLEKFALDCERSGVDGVIIPDIPLEEEPVIENELKNHSIAFIRLAAITSPLERIQEIAKRSEGFLYAVSVTGTTGARSSVRQDVSTYLQTLKKYSNVPVLAGFGVSNPEQAKELSANCDGVIVGSKIVDLFHQGKEEEIKLLIQNSL